MPAIATGIEANATQVLAGIIGVVLLGIGAVQAQPRSDERPRAREVGVAPGILPTGPLNAITDVDGVQVGQVTLIRGDSIRTGVTAIRPHGGNVFEEKVPAGLAVGNGFGKLMGISQVRELGEIETPIVLTNTLSVPLAANGVLNWALARNPEARSVNPVVGETNDGYLNAIRRRVVQSEHVVEAIEQADGGSVEEGVVGAGTGTICFGWKGGIGTSSRRLPDKLDGYTVGVLVQTNYGGVLRILGAPIGQELGQYYLRNAVEPRRDEEGSVMIVVATDAPLSDRNLERLAHRSLIGVGRTGAPSTNGSGDYALAFSTAESVRRTPARRREEATYRELPNRRMSPLFQAVVEATEEAVYNSLFRAHTVEGHRGTVEALPLDRVLNLLRKHELLNEEEE